MEIIVGIKMALDLFKCGNVAYKWIVELEPTLDRAYNDALTEWAKNEGVRSSFARKQFSTMNQFYDYITKPNMVVSEVSSLFPLIEKMLKRDTVTYTIIIEHIVKENLNISRDIKEITSHNSNKLDELQIQVSELPQIISKLLEDYKVQNINSATLPQTKYIDIDNYITRSVRDYNKWDFNTLFNINKRAPKPLYSYITDEIKHIVLYSDAQIGKTTEIRKLAFDLYNSNIYNPFIFELKRYSSKQLIEGQIKLCNRLSDNKIDVLILDGLDEIADGQRHEAIKEIYSIKENYPELYVVVTCRENFEYSNEIEGFTKLYLNSLSGKDAISFARQNMKNSEVLKFITEIESKEYLEFIHSPFLLIETIDYFKEKSSLPANKATMYDRCIEKSLKAYKEKDAEGDIGAIGAISKMRSMLRRIAFCMVLSQKQEITLEELCIQLEIDAILANELKYISLINAEKDNGDVKISFAHNSFKEHLAATILSERSLNEITNAICYKDTELIKPTMYNTVVSLLSIISNKPDDTELVDWLACDSTRNKILIEFGGEMSNKEQRITIFKSVYAEYKEKGLQYDWSNKLYSDKMLMQFCNTKESIDFLFTELETESTLNINKINALRLLRYANLSLYQGEKGNKIDYLLSICSEKDLDSEHGEYLVYVFKNRYIFELNLTVRVFEKAKNSTNERVRNHLCKMITKSELCDKYIEWVFNNYYMCGNFITLINIEETELKDYFRGLKEPNNIIRAIDYASHHIVESRLWRDEEHIVTILFENLLKFSNENTKTELISNIKLQNYYDLNTIYADGCRMYFENKAIAEEVFTYYLEQVEPLLDNLRKDGSRDMFVKTIVVLAILSTKNRINALLENTDINRRTKDIICNHLHQYQILHPDVRNIIHEFSNYLKGQKTSEEQLQEKIDIMLDTPRFVAEVEQAIDGFDSIDMDFVKDNSFLYKKNPTEAVMSLLRVHQDRKTYIVSTANVHSMIGDVNRLNYYILNSLPYPQNEKRFIYSKQQLERIREIVLCCIDNKFHPQLIKKSILLIVENNLDIGESRLLSLLDYSGVSIGVDETFKYTHKNFINYIASNIDQKKIIVWIKEVLSSGDSKDEDFWYAVTKFITLNCVEELYSEFAAIMSKINNQHFKFKIAIIIVSIGEEGFNLIEESLINHLDESHQLCYFREILFPEKESKVNPDRRKKIKECIENNYEYNHNKDCIRTLISLGSEKGLKWGLEFANEDSSWASKTPFPSLHRYNSQNLDDLLEYFKLGLSLERDENNVQGLLQSVIHSLENIAYESEELRARIYSLFSHAADEYKLPILHRYAESAKIGFYENNSGIMKLTEVNALYNSYNQSVEKTLKVI